MNEHSDRISSLRNHLRAQVETARAFNTQIRATRGPARHAVQMAKRRHGVVTRHLHAALAYLRGRSYRALEPRCHTRLSAYDVAAWTCAPAAPTPATIQAVEAWIKAPACATALPPAPEVAA